MLTGTTYATRPLSLPEYTGRPGNHSRRSGLRKGARPAPADMVLRPILLRQLWRWLDAALEPRMLERKQCSAATPGLEGLNFLLFVFAQPTVNNVDTDRF